jgi:hypothetical protein
MPARAGTFQRIVDDVGYMSFVVSPVSATSSTAEACSIFSALNGPLSEWQPMSPRAPVPKSHHPRHTKGWYTGLPLNLPSL